MSLTVAFPNVRSQQLWLVLFAWAYVLIVLFGLQAYITPLSAECILGSVGVALSLRQGTTGKQVLWFTAAAVIFALLYIGFPAKSFLFLAISMALLCLAAAYRYKSGWVTIFSLAMMSPIFDYAASVFSFPIKLYLTALAAKMLQVLQPGIRAEGNVLVSNGFEFSVDTACLGLHMLNISMLAGLIIVSWFEKRKERALSLAGILVCVLIIFLLNVVSNLIRIICLVLWKIAPENPMHDVVGIVCFSLYVIAPMLYFVPLCLRLFARDLDAVTHAAPLGRPGKHHMLNLALLSILATAVLLGKGKSLNGELIPLNNVVIPGYVSTSLEHRVTKLTNKDALVYIKPIAGFFSSDHQPMICWSGSGYAFTRVQQRKINNKPVYTATLEKGNEHLYTAWWYDNGVSTTISQVEWRWKALSTQQHYSIVNVTAATPETLEAEASKMLLLKPGKRG